jgi:hypothetical protein
MAQLQSTSVSGSVLISGSTSATGVTQILGSGSTVLYVSGSTGALLSVTDTNSGLLLTVNTGSTLIFGVDSSLNTTVTGSIIVTGSGIFSGSIRVTGSVSSNIVANSTIFSVVTSSIGTDQNDFSPTGWNNTDPNKATTLAISASFSSKISGLAGGSQGRVAVIRNISKDRLIILENNSLSSSAANTFAMRTPVFLIPSESFSFVYDSSISRWIPWGQSLGFNGFFDQYEEFSGAAAATTAQQSGQWAPTFSGTGATVAISTYLQNATEKNVGIVQVTTGTTATGRAHFGFAQNNALITGQGQGVCLSRVALQALSTTANYVIAYAGWQNSVGITSASNAVCWIYDVSGSTAWRGLAISASISSSLLGVSGPIADTNYTWLGVYVNPQWTRSCFFYSVDSINWVIAGEVSGSFPTASSGASIGFGAGLTKASGSTANLMSIDLLAHRYDIVRG